MALIKLLILDLTALKSSISFAIKVKLQVIISTFPLLTELLSIAIMSCIRVAFLFGHSWDWWVGGWISGWGQDASLGGQEVPGGSFLRLACDLVFC